MSHTNKRGVCGSKFFRLATEKEQSPYREPEWKKQLLVASNKFKLLGALDDMAREEGAQLRHARPDTPDICVFPASVTVVDRRYLGAENWRFYCQFLEEVNNDTDEYPLRDDDGEILLEEPIYDKTPIIIIDAKHDFSRWEGREEFPAPEYALGEVLYIDQHLVDMVVEEARRLLRESAARFSPARAVGKREEKDLKSGKIKRIL